MAVLVMTNAKVTIASVDLSGWVRSLTLNYNAEVKETTAMGVGSKQRVAGLIDWSVEIEFNQDYACSAVDDTIFELIGTSGVAIAIRPTADAVGPTNPEFQGVGVIESYAPLSGSVGDVSTTNLSFQGSGVLTRDVSP